MKTALFYFSSALIIIPAAIGVYLGYGWYGIAVMAAGWVFVMSAITLLEWHIARSGW